MRHREIVREYLATMDGCAKPVNGSTAAAVSSPGFGQRYSAADFDTGDGASYTGYYEKTAPCHDIAVSRGDIRIRGRSRQRLLGDDMLRVRLNLAGEGRFEGLGKGAPAHFRSHSCTLIDQAPGADLAQVTEADGRHYGVTLLLPRFLLTSAWGIEAASLPEFFRDFERQDRRQPRAVTMPLGPELAWCALEIMRCPLSGGLLDLYLDGKTREIASLLLQRLQPRPGQPSPVLLYQRDLRLLHEARRIVADRYMQPPDLAELAARVGLNRNKLCVGFKRLFGQTVFEYCRELRMQRSLQLLREGDSPLLDIALRLGYQTAPAFSRAFKRRFGCSPSEFRYASPPLLPVPRSVSRSVPRPVPCSGDTLG